jgi:hypothetical protein
MDHFSETDLAIILHASVLTHAGLEHSRERRRTDAGNLPT